MDDQQDYDASHSYDTQPGDTDPIAMGNVFPQPTRTYPQQPPGQQQPVAGQPGLTNIANQTTIQAQPVIHPIYGQPPAPQPAPPPMVQQPVAPPPIPTQGTTLPATQRQRAVIAAPQTRGMSASAISVILGIMSIAIGLLPACGVVALVPGVLGILYGWRGMRTRKRNLALLGLLLSVAGIILAFAVVV